MSILREVDLKIKALFQGKTGKDIYVVLIIILVASAAFGLGRLSVQSGMKDEIQILYPEEKTGIVEGAFRAPSGIEESQPVATSGQFVGSKNGTKYHFPWCSGAQRIKDENKVWFETREEAERAGYTPAANCKGL